MTCLSGRVLEEGNEVVSVLGLLETSEGHLGTGNVLLWVLEVIEESVLGPMDTSTLVGVGVGVALGVSRLTAKNTVEVGSDFVGTTFLGL